jgi:glucosamine 6-phosphate synthetase-like amidotransferase/phosphosugar isomerase protein
MCGVLGVVGVFSGREWRPAHRLLARLAVAHEVRGVDAAGFAALTSRGELLWARQPGPAGDLFHGADFTALRRNSVFMAIGHTRLATTGAPAINGNNHPHLAGDLSNGRASRFPKGVSPLWAVVHNGFIPAHEDKAAALKLPLHSQCDSELLVQALCRYGEQAGPDVCLSFAGKQSVLAINARTRRMLAWTNGEMPLVAFRVDGLPGLWWASTEEIAQEALEAVGLDARFADARPGLVYRMEVRDGEVVIQTPQPKTLRNRRA